MIDTQPGRIILLALFVAGLANPVIPAPAASAQDKKADAATLSSDVNLTPEEQAERDGRKACKVAICDAFHNRKPGADIACAITKSMRKEQLTKIVSKAKVSWPWGRVVCKTDVKASRDMLIKAMTEAKAEAQFEMHKITCTVERDKESPSEITAELSPKITFENGKATKASLQWGKVEGPTVIKGAMWTATAADNTIGVLQSMIVEDVNDFVDKKCEEVKADWAGK
jgi:hypothetical protein